MLEITKKYLKRKLQKHPRPSNHLNIKHLNLLKKVQKKTNIQAQRFPLSVKNDALSEKGDHLEREIEMKFVFNALVPMFALMLLILMLISIYQSQKSSPQSQLQ